MVTVRRFLKIVKNFFSLSRENVERPTDGRWFQVNPGAINRQFFADKRDDWQQESMRQIILEAFFELDSNPQKYDREFETLMPQKNLECLRACEIGEISKQLGGRTAIWVEQALEWAQRIQNGDSWENICNNPDTASCYRLVCWKDGYLRLVGGSTQSSFRYPASDVSPVAYNPTSLLVYTVPLVVRYSV